MSAEEYSRSIYEHHQVAEKLSAHCFLNSLQKEKGLFTPRTVVGKMSQLTDCQQAFTLAVTYQGEPAKLWLPLKKVSLIGQHLYGWPCFLRQSSGEIRTLEFIELVQLLLQQPQLIAESRPEAIDSFCKRVEQSCKTISLTLARRSAELAEGWHRKLSFIEAEQALIVGHSFHPSPKSRDGFSDLDLERYSPEFAQSFPLAWFAVADAIFTQDQSANFSTSCFAELVKADPTLQENLQAKCPAGYHLLPAHPWQYQHLLAHAAMKQLIKNELLIPLGDFGLPWHATSSLRTIYRPHSPFMLKFSLSVRLTNSIRHLLPVEVKRGIQVHEVFSSSYVQPLIEKYPNFHILHEPAFAAIKSSQGEILPETIVSMRLNPFPAHEEQESIVLATLTQHDPFDRGNRVSKYIYQLALQREESFRSSALLWFDCFCRNILEPLLIAQADYGILLGAHQQNIIVGIKNKLPEALYFRDCQGTGYSVKAYQCLQSEIASLDMENGNILTEEQAIPLFTYYLIVNTSFNVISAIASQAEISEEDLLSQLTNFLRILRERQPREPYCLDFLLQSKALWTKANFLCSLQAINENTMASPFALYIPTPNYLNKDSSFQLGEASCMM
ncbi:MAG: IucA/IucC family protein [Oligoflexus sp.]